MKETTALIILNYNNCTDTVNCINSVLKFNTAPIKFIIVDNASSESQRQSLSNRLNEIFTTNLKIVTPNENAGVLPLATLCMNDQNEGYARGNNLGLDLAYQDPEIQNVMILNNDVLFVEDIIPELTKRKNSLDRCAIVSPVLYKPGLKEYDYNCARRNEKVGDMIKKNFLHYYWRWRKKEYQNIFPERYILNEIAGTSNTIEIELPSGSCMLLDKDLMKKIGGFDPNTFLYYEENILYKKLEVLGLKNYICHDLKCVHLGAASISKSPSSIFIIKEGIKSQRYYVNKYSGTNELTKLIYYISSIFFFLSIKLQKKLYKRKYSEA